MTNKGKESRDSLLAYIFCIYNPNNTTINSAGLLISGLYTGKLLTVDQASDGQILQLFILDSSIEVSHFMDVCRSYGKVASSAPVTPCYGWDTDPSFLPKVLQ